MSEPGARKKVTRESDSPGRRGAGRLGRGRSCSTRFSSSAERNAFEPHWKEPHRKDEASYRLLSSGGVERFWIPVRLVALLPQRPHTLSRLGDAVRLLQDCNSQVT